MTANGGTRFLLPEGGGRSYGIAVTGPLNGPAASSLRCLLQDFERDHVTLDLSGCACLTDDALVALFAASQTAASRGGSLRIRPTVDRPTAMTQAYRGGAERSTWGTREPVAESPLAGRG
jgi:hypothetical protein